MPENGLFTYIYTKENYQKMEQILGFTDAKTHGKCCKNAAFFVNLPFRLQTSHVVSCDI